MDRFLCVAASSPAEFPPLPHSNFLKAVKWSPDGTRLLSNSEDHRLRCFPLPFDLYGAADKSIEEACTQGKHQLVSSRQFKESDCIYDFAWYPGMADEVTSCFASTACDAPIHLWDVGTGNVRATYRAHGHADEVMAAFSVSFTSDSTHLLGGYKNVVRIFDVGRPGRDCQEVNVLGKKKAREVGGMVSTIACRPESSVFAIGSFNAKVGLYDRQQRQGLIAVLEAHCGGVTQVLFSATGTLLATGARRESTVHCWDMRHLQTPLYSMERLCRNNQKVLFDFDWLGHHLYSACQTGCLKVFELQRSGALVASQVVVDNGVLNCVAVHPRLPLLATSSGERVMRPLRPPQSSTDSDSNDTDSSTLSTSDSSSSEADGLGRPLASGQVEVLCGPLLHEHYLLAVEAGEEAAAESQPRPETTAGQEAMIEEVAEEAAEDEGAMVDPEMERMRQQPEEAQAKASTGGGAEAVAVLDFGGSVDRTLPASVAIERVPHEHPDEPSKSELDTPTATADRNTNPLSEATFSVVIDVAPLGLFDNSSLSSHTSTEAEVAIRCEDVEAGPPLKRTRNEVW